MNKEIDRPRAKKSQTFLRIFFHQFPNGVTNV